MADASIVPSRPWYRRGDVVLAALALATVAAACGYLLFGLRGNVAFVIELRMLRLIALVEVAVAVAVSTVVLQTVSSNHIVTPSILGLDALYILGQTLLLLALGMVGYAAIDDRLKFVAESILLAGLAVALFLPMLARRIDMGTILLAGVVLGLVFRSLNTFAARLIDPNEFAILQGATIASFNSVRGDLLLVAGIIMVACIAAIWRLRHVLDVLALGPDTATSLGVRWRRMVASLLCLSAILVAVSTALVGPVAFFGLLVVALAERLVDSRRHHLLLPASVLVAVVVLVGGQATLQHGFGGESSLRIMIEFFGGMVFLGLLMRRWK